jgi:hypothetical protein
MIQEFAPRAGRGDQASGRNVNIREIDLRDAAEFEVRMRSLGAV